MAKQSENAREELWSFAMKGDLAGVVKFFKRMVEAKRAQLRPATTALLREWRRVRGEDHAKLESPNGKVLTIDTREFEAVCDACVIATFPKAEVLKHFNWGFGYNYEKLNEVLIDRRPAWLDEFITDALDRDGRARGSWFSLARHCFDAGLIAKPKCDGYTLGLIDWIFWNRGKRANSILAVLKRHPDMLADIWRFFEVEGGGETSLANSEKYGGKWSNDQSWTKALKQLADDGKLDRQRLLDESLKSLARDFAQYRAGWYSRFHEYMQPTAEERAQRVDAYCNLLSSNIPPTVSFALNALEQVQKSGKLPPQPILGAISPALRAQQQGAVKQAMRIIEGFAGTAKSRDVALNVSVVALEHPAAEVQQAALRLFRKHGVPAGVKLSDLAESLAASVRREFADLLGQKATQPKSVPANNKLIAQAKALPQDLALQAGVPDVLKALECGEPVPALVLDTAHIPRLDPSKRTVPLADLDELIDCAARIMEEPGDPDEIERMLDGICRLCDQRPADFEKRTAQLAKRARHRAANGWGSWDSKSELQPLAVLLLEWITGQKHTMERQRTWHSRKFTGSTLIMQPRLEELLVRVRQRKPFQLLSAPTHQGGWIDPLEISERLANAEQVMPQDAIVAMLRLAPEHRSVAHAVVTGKGEIPAAIRYALGGELPRSGIRDLALWHAASLARNFGSGDSALGRHFKKSAAFFEKANWKQSVLVDDKGEYTFRYLILKPVWGGRSDKNAELGSTCHVLHIGERFNESWCRSADALRWMATHFNVCRELFQAVGAVALGNNLDWSEVSWEDKAYLETLLDPDTSPELMTTLCLVLGLAAREPGQHGLATDILIRAIEDGRIAGENLGASMGTLLFTGLIKPTRWAKSLGQAAGVSPLHAQVVRLAIERALADAGKSEPPLGLNELLDLFHQLAIEASRTVENPLSRRFLERIKASGKTAKAAKALLALSTDPSRSHNTEAANLALRGRLARAARWHHNRTGVNEDRT